MLTGSFHLPPVVLTPGMKRKVEDSVDEICTNWIFLSIHKKNLEESLVSDFYYKTYICFRIVHCALCVICHVSRVTCHVSHVTCQLSHVFFFFFFLFFKKMDKGVELVGGGSVINGAYPI